MYIVDACASCASLQARVKSYQLPIKLQHLSGVFLLQYSAKLSSAYPVDGSVSEVNCSAADMQVISCYCHPTNGKVTIIFSQKIEHCT